MATEPERQLRLIRGRARAKPDDEAQFEFAFLTPKQWRALHADPWDGSGIIVFNAGLPAEAFERAPAGLVLNARALLGEIRDHGPVRLTPAGNLPRAIVAHMLERMHWRTGELERIREGNKVINELDAGHLFDVRELLQHAKYLRVLRGALRITPAGRAALDPDQTGRLALRLFRAHFRELAFPDMRGERDPAAPQAAVPLLLWHLRLLGRGWQSAERLLPDCRPELRHHLSLAGRFAELPGFQLLIDDFMDFGLLDARTERNGETLYRPSRLFQQFVTWTIPLPWPDRTRREHPVDHFTTPLVYGELTHAQAAAIMTDPLDGTGPLRIEAGLPVAAFTDTPMLGVDNARRMLALLETDGVWRLDEYDNLPDAVAVRLLDALEWWPGFLTEMRESGEPVTERALSAVWGTRKDLLNAELIHADGPGRLDLRITEDGLRLIDRERTGELAARLLTAHLRDVGYAEESPDDVVDPNRGVRRRYKLVLWKLSRVPAGWLDVDTLVRLLTMPEMLDEMRQYSWADGALGVIVQSLVLSRFADSGLLERDLDAPTDVRRYRRTQVFDRMLSWRL